VSPHRGIFMPYQATQARPLVTNGFEVELPEVVEVHCSNYAGP